VSEHEASQPDPAAVDPPEEPLVTEPDETEEPAPADAEGAPPESDDDRVAADDAEDKDDPPAKPAKELAPEARALCKSAVEAMLFSSADPLSTRRLADALKGIGIDGRGVRKIVRELTEEYDRDRRGFTIEEIAGGFKMVTQMEYAEYVGNLLGSSRGGRLSQAALETLAVVAYKQPVTRADVEVIRGVQAGPLLRSLLQKGLVRITGRAEVIGRPLLYGTTRRFLEHFGLKSLNELPKVEELPKP